MGHALLSPSASHRWLNCTPSAMLEKDIKGTTSVYAEEGSLAHDLAELELNFHFKNITKRTYNSRLKKIKANPLFKEEMLAYVEDYTTFVIERCSDHSTIDIEKKIELSDYIIKGSGTGDAIVISNITLHVCDLKYGKGVAVDAESNTQLMIYALGALKEYELSYDIQEVELCIIQPRIGNYSTWTIPVKDLLQWANTILIPIAQTAYKGKGVQKSGPWCKFCKVKAECATIAADNMKLAKHDFKSPHLLDKEDLLSIYGQIDKLVDWANSVSDHILKSALSGEKWDGYKLVEGRSMRKWKDEKEVAERLTSEGYGPEEFMISKLGGIGAIEKLIGKKDFNLTIGDLVIKPQGKPTLVPESDKRPEFNSAETDFNN